MSSNHFVLCHPLLLLPSIFPSIRIFFNESALCIRWPKYWSFSFSVSSTNEFLGLIFFRIDCFDLLAVQGTLKSLFQLHSSKASILWPSAFFMVQLSHPYMTTGKTIALTVWTFVGKMMSLLFNMLSRFVIDFPPRRTPWTVWKENESTAFLQRLMWGLHELIHVQWLGQSWPILNAPWTLAVPVYCFFFKYIWRNGTKREVGGGFRMGNTCTPVADSCWCVAEPIQCCKVIILQLSKFKLKK